MATFTTASIGSNGPIAITSPLSLASLRAGLVARAVTDTVERPEADILNETIQVQSGTTLVFQDSTGSEITFTGTWMGDGAVEVRTFTSAGEFNVAGTINLKGGISHAGGVTGQLRIGNNVGTTGNVPISCNAISGSHVAPLEFYKASTDPTDPVINATITGTRTGNKFIRYAGDITLHDDHRNNSDLFNDFVGIANICKYSNMRSLLNTSITTDLSQYWRFDSGVVEYTGAGGYTHPANLGITITDKDGAMRNRGSNNPVAEVGGDYSNLIDLQSQIIGDGNLLLQGFGTDKEINSRGYRSFRIGLREDGTVGGVLLEDDVILEGEVTVARGATLILEGSNDTSALFDARGLFVHGDLLCTGRITANLTIGDNGRFLPGIKAGETATVAGNLTMADGSAIHVSVGNSTIDNVRVLAVGGEGGRLNFGPEDGHRVNVYVFPMESTFTGTALGSKRFIRADSALDLDNDKIRLIQYEGTEGTIISIIDQDNDDYPISNNNTIATSITGGDVNLIIS